MPGQAVIGALRVDLSLDTASFQRGIAQADKDAAALGKKLQGFGKAMAGVGVAMTAGITLPFAALIKSAIPAAIESRNALGQVEAALKSMGPAAQRTTQQLQDQAKVLMGLSLFDDDDILAKVTANLLTFGNVSGQVFDRAQRAIVDISARMGTDLQASAIMVGKALNDPVKGLAALRRVGIQFTEQQQAQIKAMAKVGDVAGAQSIMLAELERQFKGSAKAAQDAHPGDDAKDAWHDFQETVGGIALNVLPRLTAVLKTALDVFNNLSPGLQTTTVAAVAVAAALGPIVTIGGGLVTLLGAVTPALVTLGTGLVGVGEAGGVVAPLLAGLSTVLLPLAAAAGAVYLAWKNWDTVGPMLQQLGQTVTASLGPTVLAAFESIRSTLSDLWSGPFGVQLRKVMEGLGQLAVILLKVFGPVILALLRGFVTVVAEVFATVGRVLNTLVALLSGDFSGAWEGVKAVVVGVVTGLGHIIEAVIPGSIAWLAKLYQGAKTWLVDKMTALVDFVLAPIRQIAQGFAWLYDKVVGHSYVPDMVDGIAAQMARLDAVMVTPAKKGTTATAAAFRKMADDIKPIMDRLFPEAAALVQYHKDLAAIAAAEKAGTAHGGLSAAQAEEARQRLARENLTKADDKPSFLADAVEPTTQDASIIKDQLASIADQALPDLSKSAADHTAMMVQSFADMAQNVVNSLQGLVSAIKKGGFLNIFMGVIDVIKTGVSTYMQIKSGGGLGGGGGGGFPGFAQGGSFEVGGRAGVDTNLIQFKATKGERVDITKPGQTGLGRGGVVFDLRGAVMTEDLLRQMNEMADGAAMRGAIGGAALGADRARRANRRRLA